jgi:hypothetical protein
MSGNFPIPRGPRPPAFAKSAPREHRHGGRYVSRTCYVPVRTWQGPRHAARRGARQFNGNSDRGWRILLVIVARHDAALFQYLSRSLTGVQGVEVILDRRQAERRRQRQAVTFDRRASPERRVARGERRYLGYTFVNVERPPE